MAKEKLNKDGLEPGSFVSPEDYRRIQNENRIKNPYSGIIVPDKPTKVVKNSNTEDYARSVATDRQGSFQRSGNS
jgi:hypothetical protein